MRRISLPPRDDRAIEGRVTIQRSIDDVKSISPRDLMRVRRNFAK